MNIRKLKIRRYVFILGIPIAAYLIVLWGHKEAARLIDPLAIQILAILVGLIIGAVGVLMALLGNLFNDLIVSFEKRESDQEDFAEGLGKWMKNCTEMVIEIKEDVIFLIIALLSCSIISLLKTVDIPDYSWPFINQLITPQLLLNSISLTFLGYSFIAIIDVVDTMFIIYEHNEIILSDRFEKIRRTKLGKK